MTKEEAIKSLGELNEQIVCLEKESVDDPEDILNDITFNVTKYKDAINVAISALALDVAVDNLRKES